jgi:hypothetical protein
MDLTDRKFSTQSCSFGPIVRDGLRAIHAVGIAESFPRAVNREHFQERALPGKLLAPLFLTHGFLVWGCCFHWSLRLPELKVSKRISALAKELKSTLVHIRIGQRISTG